MNINIFFKYALCLWLLCMAIGCVKEEASEIVEVDSRLQIYFDRFAEEGAARGVAIDYDINKIAGKIEDIDSGTVAGQCQTNSIRANLIIIDLDFWNTADEMGKEFVIFHELGHCYLGRDHLDDATDDGTCVSMMHSGMGNCTNSFNNSTRSALLDELFNP